MSCEHFNYNYHNNIVSAMKCSTPTISHASYKTDNYSIDYVLEVTCDDGYRIVDSTNNTINTTCVVDMSGLFADWCWVLPCEGMIEKVL